jgi:hypothetical protein
LLGLDLRREVDAALSVRDWTTAERTLRDLAALDPTNPSALARNWRRCSVNMGHCWLATTVNSG